MFEILAESALVDRFGWVLVHTLWQFALVAALAVVLQRALYRCTAVTKYWALLVTMGAMVAVPVATWFWLAPADPPQRTIVLVTDEMPEAGPRPEPAHHSALPPADEAITSVGVPAPAASEFETPQPEPRPADLTPVNSASLFSRVQSRVQSWLPAIVLVWLVGVFVAALRPLLSWHTVRRLRTDGVEPVRETIEAALRRAADRLGITRSVALLQSALVKAPVVVGCFRPAILLPLSVLTELPQSQLELILAHELAHIRRHDYLVNLIQAFVETLFFYHPGVWWLSRTIRNERENCCDDVAMSTVNNRAEYGEALLAMARLRSVATPLPLAARGGSLLSRIRRIAGCEPAPKLAGGASILCGLLLALVLLASATWGRTPATADPEPPTADAAPAPPPTPASTASDQSPRRTLRFHFRFRPWTEVLQWYAKEAGLALVMDSPPPGTLNYSDDRQYTPEEAMDLLNGVLLKRDFALIKRDKVLTVVNATKGIPDGLAPVIEVEDLAKHGDFEFVTVCIPLGRRDATSLLPKIKAITGTLGKVVPLPDTGQLEITDRAGNVRRMAALIEGYAQAPVTEKGIYESCRNATNILLELQETDLSAYLKAGNLRMLLLEFLDPAALAEVRGEGDASRVMELANWPKGPVQVISSGKLGDLRIRSEEIRIVIYCRRKTPLAMDAAPRDVIRQATRPILASRYRLGPDGTITSRRGSTTDKTCKMLSENTLSLDGRKAVACHYRGVNGWGGDSLPLFSSVRVLAVGKDVVIVAEKLVARGIILPSTPEYFAGLIASKTRLKDVEAKEYPDQPILAEEIVFDGKADLSELPRELVNGCMWPIGDKAAVGLKDLCSTAILYPYEKVVSTPDVPSRSP